jgi:hypothetical protein
MSYIVYHRVHKLDDTLKAVMFFCLYLLTTEFF